MNINAVLVLAEPSLIGWKPNRYWSLARCERLNYQFWKRNSLPIILYTPEVIYQKLDYIHNNPVQGKWMLANSPIEYKYSSAKFYETGIDDFGFLTHIGDRI
jgi:hypothetical protein